MGEGESREGEEEEEQQQQRRLMVGVGVVALIRNGSQGHLEEGARGRGEC